MYHDKMAQTVPTINSISVQTGEMELGSSNLADVGGVNHRNLAEGEESSPSEDSMVLEEDEATRSTQVAVKGARGAIQHVQGGIDL